MNQIRWLILALLLTCPLTLTAIYVREYLAVDAALDAGASYDNATGRADFAQNHPGIPFGTRHGKLLVLSVCSIIGALLLLGTICRPHPHHG